MILYKLDKEIQKLMVPCTIKCALTPFYVLGAIDNPALMVISKTAANLVGILMAPLVMLLLACLSAAPAAADSFMKPDIITQPVPALFSICYDHSCTSVETVSLTKEEWRRAIAPLTAGAASASDERAAIAESIAIFEEIIGEHLGTSADRGGNLAGLGKAGQLDCIDESTNTSTYLRMLEQEGLLTYHTVMNRSTRFGIFVGMPHTTAVIRENDSGVRYAVDSWFFDNGQPPYIVKLEDWKSGKDPY